MTSEETRRVAQLIADPPHANSTDMHSRLIEIYVLAVQPIGPVRQNRCNFWTHDAILKWGFRMSYTCVT